MAATVAWRDEMRGVTRRQGLFSLTSGTTRQFARQAPSHTGCGQIGCSLPCTAWCQSPGYDLRRTCRDLPDLTRNAAHGGINQRSLSEHSKRFRGDAEEELGHAQQLIERMLVLGISSKATQLQSIRTGRTLEEMLLIDRELEIEVIHLYEEATRYCARMRDSETQALFARLLQDELGHLRDLDQMLTEIYKGTTS